MKIINVRILLIVIYIGSVFIDMYTGYSMSFKNGTSLQFIFKGFIILYSLPYLLRGNKVSIFMLIGLLLLLINIFYWNISGYTNMDRRFVTYIARLIYPYCLFLILYFHRNKLDNDDILHFAMYYGVIASCSILLLDFTNLGVATISTEFGYGVKGFFAAGNDMALALLLCSCISCYYASFSNKSCYIVYNVIIMIACFRIGIRAAVFGSTILLVLFVVQSLLIRQEFSKKYYKYKTFLLFCGIPLAIYGISLIMQTDSYMMRKYDIAAMLEGKNVRSGLINSFYRVHSNFSVTDNLFGIGYEELSSRVGFNLYSMNKIRAIEVDHLELIGSYGYILGFAIIVFPVSFFCKYALSFLKKRQIGTYWISIALLLYVAHGFIAGHAYTSIQASTIMIGLLFYNDRNELE